MNIWKQTLRKSTFHFERHHLSMIPIIYLCGGHRYVLKYQYSWDRRWFNRLMNYTSFKMAVIIIIAIIIAFSILLTSSDLKRGTCCHSAHYLAKVHTALLWRGWCKQLVWTVRMRKYLKTFLRKLTCVHINFKDTHWKCTHFYLK